MPLVPCSLACSVACWPKRFKSNGRRIFLHMCIYLTAQTRYVTFVCTSSPTKYEENNVPYSSCGQISSAYSTTSNCKSVKLHFLSVIEYFKLLCPLFSNKCLQLQYNLLLPKKYHACQPDLPPQMDHFPQIPGQWHSKLTAAESHTDQWSPWDQKTSGQAMAQTIFPPSSRFHHESGEVTHFGTSLCNRDQQVSVGYLAIWSQQAAWRLVPGI